MGFVLSLLTSRLAGPIASVLLILAVLFGVSQCSGRVNAEHKLGVAVKERDAARADLGTCKANVATLDGALSRQNAAVDALRQESAARVAQSEKAVSAARSVAASYRKSAAAILAARPRGASACQSADALIAEAVR